MTLHDAYEHLLEPYSVPGDPKDPEDLLIKLATTQAYYDMPRAGQVHVAFAWSWDRDLNMPFGPGEERWTAQKIRAQASFLPEAERRRMVEGLALALDVPWQLELLPAEMVGEHWGDPDYGQVAN